MYHIIAILQTQNFNIYRLNNAHEAGMTSLMVVSGTGTWLATESFDKRVKIWSTDGNIKHTIVFR